jgi:hypothetical protein
VKVASFPLTDQWPELVGDTVGTAVAPASGVENVAVIEVAPFTPVAPPEGVTETRVRGAGGFALGRDAVLLLGRLSAALLILVEPDELPLATTVTPTASAAPAPAAVAAIQPPRPPGLQRPANPLDLPNLTLNPDTVPSPYLEL